MATTMQRRLPTMDRALAIAGFRRLEEVSRGRHASIVKALDTANKRIVAIKMLRPHVQDDDEVRARLAREGASLARVEHPNVIEVYDVVTEPEPFYTMPLLDGPLLAKYRRRGPAPLRSLLALGIGLADGLAAIHSVGLVHRDLRPENVLIVTGGPVILDLGLAKDLGSMDELTKSALAIEPDYAAPELARGERAGVAADLYALGVMLLEFALGKHPFRDPEDPIETVRRQLEEEPPSLRATRPDLPPQLERLLAALLAKDPVSRPRTAFSVSHTLQLLQMTLTSGGMPCSVSG